MTALEKFTGDLRALLLERGVAALPQIAERLSVLVADPTFVAATFSDDLPPGKRVLFHDPETDVYVLAHVQVPGKGAPHSHGTSWAVYGNARASTAMTLWKRVNDESEPGAVLDVIERHTITPGTARYYGPGVIHSTEQNDRAWVIRVTGTDLDVLPRYRFSRQNDRIVEPAPAN
jgi:hypothetical protein